MENILCEHWGLFSATFPTSGMMRGGKLFPLPLLAHRTDGNESSSSPILFGTVTTATSGRSPEFRKGASPTPQEFADDIALLRTPVASEAEGGAIHPDDAKAGGNTLKLGWQLLALGGHINPKLPTPTVSYQYTDNLASSQQSDGSMHSVTLAQIVNRPDLLPTPTAQAAKHGSTPDETANNHGSNLWDVTVLFPKLLPTTMASMKGASQNEIAKGNPKGRLEVEIFLTETWGKFAPAIQQWETITGNPAPPPTIPDGRDGQARLNPQFAEWMMGLPPGWITDCDITRNEQLKACGNGVVPQQATLAITRLIQGVTL